MSIKMIDLEHYHLTFRMVPAFRELRWMETIEDHHELMRWAAHRYGREIADDPQAVSLLSYHVAALERFGSSNGPISPIGHWGAPMRPARERNKIPVGPMVYALFVGEESGAPVYIGSSRNAANRMNHHAYKHPDVTGVELFQFESVDEMETVEGDLIAMMRPARNKQIIPVRWRNNPKEINTYDRLRAAALWHNKLDSL